MKKLTQLILAWLVFIAVIVALAFISPWLKDVINSLPIRMVIIFGLIAALPLALFFIYQGNKELIRANDEISAKLVLSLAYIAFLVMGAWYFVGTALIDTFELDFYDKYTGQLSDGFGLVYVWLIPLYYKLTHKFKSLTFGRIITIKQLFFWPSVLFWLYGGVEFIADFLPFENWIVTTLLLIFYATGAWFTVVTQQNQKS